MVNEQKHSCFVSWSHLGAGVTLLMLCVCLFVTQGRATTAREYDPVAEALDYVEQIARQKNNCSFGPSLNLNYDKIRWTAEAEVAVRAANLLSTLFRTGHHMRGIHEADTDLLYAVVLSNVENNINVFGSAIAFIKYHYRDYEIYCPYAFRAPEGITAKDLSIGYDYHTNGTDWFYIPLTRFEASEFNWFEQTTEFNSSYETVRYGSDLLLTLDDGYWTKPYFDCGGGDVWMVTFSMPFFWSDVDETFSDIEEEGTSRKLSFVGVTTIDVSLNSLDIQQCDLSGEDQGGVFDPFVGTHRCKNTTTCLNIPHRGFERGSYRCMCNQGYYFPEFNAEDKAFDGAVIEAEYFKKLQGIPNTYDSGFNCAPCAEGCEFCLDDRKCVLEINTILELIVLTTQAVTICVLLITGIYIFLNRENRVIKAASPSLLYILLLGASLLHTEILFLTEWVDPVSCFVQSCLRHFGFSLVYGALLLKTWRITRVFKVRSAKRVRIPDSSLLSRLGVLLVITCAYLVVAALVDFSNVKETSQVVEAGYNVKFQSCIVKWWDYAGLGVEMVLLIWGIYLCVRVRKAPSEFNESRFISFSIYNQTIVQIFVPVLEIALYDTLGSPNLIALVGFTRVHLTATMMVGLIFGSKIVFVYQEANKAEKSNTKKKVSTVSTVDSGTIEFSSVNPDVKSEMDRMENFISKIAAELRDSPQTAGQTSNDQDMSTQRGRLRKRNEDFKRPKVYMKADHHDSAASLSTTTTSSTILTE
ncbi:probable G-protein coupled receptor CG31760 isoform X2 [Apostichopus japonicus]